VVYSQRNVPGLPAVPWAGQRLGWCNGVTLGSDGCYVTADAQVATHYEHPITPGQMDDRMTGPDPAHSLYAAGASGCKDLMYDNNLSKVFPDIQYVETRSWPGAADLSYLRMAGDEEIIIGLDNLNQGSLSRHFARVFDYNPVTGVLLIDDPWWGRTLNFASLYGSPARNVMKAVKYRKPGWVPPWKRVVPPVVQPPVVVAPPAVVDPKDAEIADLKARLAQSIASALVTSGSLATTVIERDVLKMAWNHLDATFAEVRSSIPK
jgi:hypothetical protein